MVKNKIKRTNNRIIPGRKYDCLTLAAEKIVIESIEKMVQKLCKLKNVEYFDWEDEGEPEACLFNNDTAFRDNFYAVIEEEVRKGLYKYG